MSAQLKYSPDEIGERITEIRNEIKRLEAKQAMYRRVIGPRAAELVKEWQETLNSIEMQFAGLVRTRVEGNRKPTLDMSLLGAVAFFCREDIEDRLPELAFYALGNTEMHLHDRHGDGYVHTGPALKALRAELEQLTATN